MDPAYSPPHSFPVSTQSRWAGDVKSAFLGDPSTQPVGSSILESAITTPSTSMPNGRSAILKVEDETQSSEQMWHNRMHDPYADHSTLPHSHLMNGHGSQMFRMSDSNMMQMSSGVQWPTSQSGSSTPTAIYGPTDGFGPLSFASMGSAYHYQHEPSSAVPMSPQSSQGGWASAASSDGVEQRGMLQSPIYRPPSPTLVVRSDGIRKKNARFEIPKERNLSNIDAMIQQTTDETEKKELKQQKRLLRNRQAALDSRQRKKTHTEKLEQEKKVSEKKMFDLEEALARLESSFALERDSWLQQRQQYERFIHSLSYERDEAIRIKTLETAELRRQNNMLKDCVQDLERQQPKAYSPVTDPNTYEPEFRYDIDDQFGEQYPFDDDYRMEDAEHVPRQATPRPLHPQNNIDAKAEGFSWNTFYMCLLFGAFLAANGNSIAPTNTTTSAIASSISPAEAGNVLKAVFKHSDGDPVSEGGIQTAAIDNVPASLRDIRLEQQPPASTLDNLHRVLSTPSRRQELQAAFSLSASSYNHIVDPFNEHLNANVDHEMLTVSKPSQLQRAYADMKAQKDEVERASGIGAKLRERSLLWDQVPPQVVRDFQDLVRRSGGVSSDDSAEKRPHEG